jgi:hypothetical protein
MKKRRFPRSNILPFLMSALGCAVMLGPIFPLKAADVTWDGGAGTNNWMDGANWSTDAIPTTVANNWVYITTGAAVTLDQNTSIGSNDFTLNGNSSLEVLTGGTLKFRDPFISAGSTLIISGGVVNYRRIGTVNGKIILSGGEFNSEYNNSNGAIADVEVSGGVWHLNQTGSNATSVNGMQFGNGSVNSLLVVSSGSVVATQTIVAGGSGISTMNLSGGAISSKHFIQQRGTVEVSGGTFSTTEDYEWAHNSYSGTHKILRMIGGEGTFEVGGNFNRTGAAGIRDFVLTAKNSGLTQENISTLLVTGTDSAGGSVDVGLQGGILLAKPTTYTLIQAGTLEGSLTYVGTALFNGGVNGNYYEITRNGALDIGDLSLSELDSPVSLSFSLISTAYIDLNLEGVMASEPSLLVRLDADAGSSTLEDLVLYLSQSGYSDVKIDAVGDYDISFTISHSFLSGSSMYLGWDFTDFADGAGLSGVQITATVVPEPGSVWLLGASGLAVLIWRRRRH